MNEMYVSICGYTIVGQLQKQAVTSNAIRCQSECHFINFHSGQGRRPRFREESTDHSLNVSSMIISLQLRFIVFTIFHRKAAMKLTF